MASAGMNGFVLPSCLMSASCFFQHLWEPLDCQLLAGARCPRHARGLQHNQVTGPAKSMRKMLCQTAHSLAKAGAIGLVCASSAWRSCCLWAGGEFLRQLLGWLCGPCCLFALGQFWASMCGGTCSGIPSCCYSFLCQGACFSLVGTQGILHKTTSRLRILVKVGLGTCSTWHPYNFKILAFKPLILIGIPIVGSSLMLG